MKKTLALILAALLAIAACAETVYLDGTVVSVFTATDSFTYGGTVSDVCADVGDHVSEGELIYTIEATKVYANESGTVHLFGSVGDDCSLVSSRYGAVVYIEPEMQYTLSASTVQSYDSESNRVIHPGESVYLRSYSTTTNTGSGTVTSVSGTSYTVEVTSGSFSTGEAVNVFRDADFTNASRIGRGTVNHADPVAYTSDGILVAFAVEDGAKVEKGDLLYETVSGSYTKDTAVATEVTASESGVVISLAASKGDKVSTGSTALTYYPDSSLRIEASVTESDLCLISEGQAVTIELPYYANGETVLTGKIERISRVGTQDTETDQAVFTVYIIPDDISCLYYGMTAVAATVDSSVKTSVETTVEAPTEE